MFTANLGRLPFRYLGVALQTHLCVDVGGWEWACMECTEVCVGLKSQRVKELKSPLSVSFELKSPLSVSFELKSPLSVSFGFSVTFSSVTRALTETGNCDRAKETERRNAREQHGAERERVGEERKGGEGERETDFLLTSSSCSLLTIKSKSLLSATSVSLGFSLTSPSVTRALSPCAHFFFFSRSLRCVRECEVMQSSRIHGLFLWKGTTCACISSALSLCARLARVCQGVCQ